MGYRAIYSYAWDVAERPLADFAREVRGLGLNTVTLAGSYHAGKFIRPHGAAARSISPRTAPSISAPTKSATAASSRSRTASAKSTTCSASLPTPASR